MSDYYTFTPISGFSLARSADVNDRFAQVDTAFGTLPAAALIREDRATYAVATGTANALVAALPETLTAYTAGLSVAIKAAFTNTGPATINIDGLGAVAITRNNLDPLVAEDIRAGTVIDLRYDGTSFRMMAAINYVIAGDAAEVMTLSGTQTVTGIKTFTQLLTAPSLVLSSSGLVGTPAVRFTADPTTGFFLDGAGNLKLTSGGATKVAVTATGAAVTGTFSVTGATTLTGGVTGGLAVTGALTTTTSVSATTFVRARGTNAAGTGRVVDLYQDGTNGYVETYDWTGSAFYPLHINADSFLFRRNGSATILNATSTGLAVTGALSATETITSNTNGASGAGIALKPGTVNHAYLELYARTATPTTRSGYIGYGSPADTNLGIVNQLAGSVNINTNGAAVASFSSTGAAVTGTLSCTGNATIGDASGDSHTVNGSFTINHQLTSIGNPVIGNANPALQLYNAALTDRFAVFSHSGLGGNLTITNEEAGTLVLSTNGNNPIAIQSDAVVRLQRSAPELDLYNADGSNRYGYLFHTGLNGNLELVNEETGTMRFTTNGVNAATVSSTGVSVTSATTASAANVHQASSGSVLLRSTSSERYKLGIEPIDPARAMRTLDAEVIWFRPNLETCPEDNPSFSHYGVKAEQLATVEKRLVHWIPQPEDYPLPIGAGWPKMPDGTQLVPDGAQYERLNLLRTEALKHRVLALTAENAALKTDNEGLKTQFFDLMVRVKALEDAAA